MTDYNNDKFDGMNEVQSEETPITNETPSEENLNSTDVSSNDIYSSSPHEEPEAQDEGSYEWNAEPKEETTEYHYSYINGNNADAEHNPNNYNDNYSSYGTSNTSQSYQSDSYSDNANTQTATLIIIIPQLRITTGSILKATISRLQKRRRRKRKRSPFHADLSRQCSLLRCSVQRHSASAEECSPKI